MPEDGFSPAVFKSFHPKINQLQRDCLGHNSLKFLPLRWIAGAAPLHAPCPRATSPACMFLFSVHGEGRQGCSPSCFPSLWEDCRIAALHVSCHREESSGLPFTFPVNLEGHQGCSPLCFFLSRDSHWEAFPFMFSVTVTGEGCQGCSSTCFCLWGESSGPARFTFPVTEGESLRLLPFMFLVSRESK